LGRLPSFELETHQHRRGQLLYAASGVVAVSTPQGAWVAPPERAVWIPGGTPHAVRMVGAVSTRSVMIEPGVCGALGSACRVIEVSPLLRNLLVAATRLPREYDLDGRDNLVIELLLAELERAPVIPIAVPFPLAPELARKCHVFLECPTPHAKIADWAEELGLSRRTFHARLSPRDRHELRRVAPASLPIDRIAASRGRRDGNVSRARSGL
jgi:hypothetical protein